MKLLPETIKNKYTIYGNIRRPIIPYFVNLLYYKGKTKNVGDHLSKVIFEFLMKNSGKSFFNKQTVRFSFIGSVISFITYKSIVYGSGFLTKSIADKFCKKNIPLDIYAVRGPLTREALTKSGYIVPEIYGDPAILLPLFYKPKIKENKNDYVVIPHWSKINEYNTRNILSPITNDWKYFIDEIVSSNIVISASLHGVIIAEAYGIPAILLNDTEHEDQFKYKDYYYGTNRYEFPIATNLEEALKITPPSIPDFSDMRDKLLNAFPFSKK